MLQTYRCLNSSSPNLLLNPSTTQLGQLVSGEPHLPALQGFSEAQGCPEARRGDSDVTHNFPTGLGNGADISDYLTGWGGGVGELQMGEYVR